MTFKLGQVFVDYTGDDALTIVYLDGEWANEEVKKEYEENMGNLDEEDLPTIIAFESEQWGEYREDEYEIEEIITEYHYVPKEKYEQNSEVRNNILDLLKTHGVSTSDLIVSDGRVYIGGDECEAYIQASGAWCSSSMMC